MLYKFLNSCDYENGYKQALLDIKNWFYRHSISLTQARMYNRKKIEMLLSYFSSHSELFQREGEDMEIYIAKE